MKKVLFTGGGTAGHVSVNVALIPEFKNQDYKMIYVGSKDGIEKDMIEKIPNIEYYAVSSGKLRRYFDWKNFTDPFRVLKGIFDSLKIIKKEKPDFIFSKGGFVSVPVCIAGRLLKVPTILHESDMSPGLANKINIKFANHIFTTFEETLHYLPKEKSSLIGAIVREDIYNGNKDKAYELCGFSDREKKTLLVMGGSLGSKIINEFIWNNVEYLTKHFNIVHLVGTGSINNNIKISGYKQFEFLNKELFDVFKITDLTISRAGANSIYEFLALEIPSILVPLGINQSRGDQIENAHFFEKNGFSKVIKEELLTEEALQQVVDFSNELVRFKNNMQVYKTEKHVINSVNEFYLKILKVLEVK